MEDAVAALIMSFSVLVFVIAISTCMYMVNLTTATSEQILYTSDKTNFMENIQVSDTEITRRNVDFDTIIPTLYRYYKENFCVKMCDARDASSKTKLLQLFDIQIEGKVRSAVSKASGKTYVEQALTKTYGTSTAPQYMYGAPWLGNINKDVKTRLDYYIAGTSGYINNIKVDYTDKSGELESLAEIKRWYDTTANAEIEETFVEYNFSGETITSEDGTETITGSSQGQSKIIITYTLKIGS